MIERVAQGGRNGAGKSEEFIIIAGVTGNKSLGYSIGAHGPPFVVVPVMAVSQPDLSQVFEPPVLGDIRRRDMTVVIEKGHCLSDLEVEFLARPGREQKIFG